MMGGSRIIGPGKVRVPRFGLNAAQRKQVGGLAIARIYKRVTEQHTGSGGNSMPPYSPRGPIYVPVTGRGRTKSSFHGREVFTARDLRKMRDRGVLIIGGKRSKVQGLPGSSGLVAGRTASGKSLKFSNWAAYKQSLGKSGQRDLELSGRMLGAMTIVASAPAYIDLGFTREQEMLKAMGNQERSPWFALAPSSDVPPVTAMIEGLILDNVVKQLF
jgi:hypothetical protein